MTTQHKLPAPKAVIFLLVSQFLGLLFLSLTTIIYEPLIVFIYFSAGVALMLEAIALWVYLMYKESKEINKDIEGILKSKVHE